MSVSQGFSASVAVTAHLLGLCEMCGHIIHREVPPAQHASLQAQAQPLSGCVHRAGGINHVLHVESVLHVDGNKEGCGC